MVITSRVTKCRRYYGFRGVHIPCTSLSYSAETEDKHAVASNSFPEKAKRFNFVLETKQAPCNAVQQSTF